MRDILKTYTTIELKKLIKNSNICNYSKLKKEGLIDLMLQPEHIGLFKDIQPKSKKLPDTINLKNIKLQTQFNKELKNKKRPSDKQKPEKKKRKDNYKPKKLIDRHTIIRKFEGVLSFD